MFGGQQTSSPSQGNGLVPFTMLLGRLLLTETSLISLLLGIRLTFITHSDQTKFESLFSRAVAGTGSSNLSGNISKNEKLNSTMLITCTSVLTVAIFSRCCSKYSHEKSNRQQYLGANMVRVKIAYDANRYLTKSN